MVNSKSARVVIDKEYEIGKVEDHLYGSFVENLGRCIYGGIYEPGHPEADERGFRKDVLRVVSELNVPIIRYPGGNFTSTYRWEDGIGPVDERPARLDLAWKSIEPNKFGLNEFVDWTKLVNAEIMMTLNISTKGLLDVQNLWEYCNFPGGTYWSDLRKSHGYPAPHNITHWCLGNEPDGDWQIAQKTPQEYGRIAREAGKMLKLMDPTCNVTVSGSSLWRLRSFPAWDSIVLEDTYDYVDNVSIHAYYGNKQDDTANFLAKTLEMDNFIESAIAACDFVRVKLRRSKRLNLSIDEWNVWYHTHDDDRHKDPWHFAPHLLEEDYTFEDAVMVGCMIISILRHANRISKACNALLVNAISSIATVNNGPVWRHTTFYPFLHASNFGRGISLMPVIECPKYDSAEYTDVPYLASAVTYNDENEDLVIFAVNRDLEVSMNLECELRGFSGYRVLEHIVYESKDKKARNTQEKPLNVVPHNRGNATVHENIVTAELPRLSWNVIRLQRIDTK